jgi:DNA-binding LacI/PurR family transcriptional regulator
MTTLKNIATAAGVHPGTAAAVLNGSKGNTRVSEITRNKVLTAAKRLGYLRNESARRLRMGHSTAVGFIGGDLRNPFFAELAAALEQALALENLQLVVSHVTGSEPDAFDQSVTLLRQQTIQTILYWDETPYSQRSKTVKTKKSPEGTHLIPLGFTTYPRPGVWLDLEYAIRLSVTYFVQKNFRRVGFFAPLLLEESPSVRIRRRIFLDECRRQGLPAPVNCTYEGESWDIRAATAGAGRVLKEHADVEGFLGFNDTASLGLLLARQGRRPSPVVICFDGTSLSQSWPGHPPYLLLNPGELARRVVNLITDPMKAQTSGKREAWLQPPLVVH